MITHHTKIGLLLLAMIAVTSISSILAYHLGKSRTIQSIGANTSANSYCVVVPKGMELNSVTLKAAALVSEAAIIRGVDLRDKDLLFEKAINGWNIYVSSKMPPTRKGGITTFQVSEKNWEVREIFSE